MPDQIDGHLQDALHYLGSSLEGQDKDQHMTTEEKLHAAMEFVRLVAEEWFVSGEMYQVCFFCLETEPGNEYHRMDCPVLKAQSLLRTQDDTQRVKEEKTLIARGRELVDDALQYTLYGGDAATSLDITAAKQWLKDTGKL
jgi:hypothetical protein